MSLGKAIARSLAAGLLALALLAAAVAAPVLLSAEHSALGFWPIAVLAFVLLWMAVRSRKLGEWVSPLAFLIVSIPLLLILLGIYMVLPAIESGAVDIWTSAPAGRSFGWIPEGERESFDLSARLQTLDGQEVTLSELQDKVLFLNIWATWCGPCRSEMPSMAKLYRRLADQGFSMVAVTDEDPEAVRDFLGRNPYPFTVLLDPDQQLMRKLQINSIPTTFVIDQEQKVALYHVGAYDWASSSVVDQFTELLGE